MKITPELLESGKSARGGWTKAQLALLGLSGPPPNGWRRAILGLDVADDAARAFVALARAAAPTPVGDAPSRPHTPATGGAIYLYVLELDGKDFYVGITRDIDQRHRRHESGKGALWTSGRRSVRRLMHADTGVDNYPAAEKLEDEVTLMLMARHGIDRVRGGHYCALARDDIEVALRAHGHWEHVRRSGMERVSFDTQASWSDALDAFLVQALRYYDGGYTDAQREAVFLEGCRLTRYAYWHDDFAPGLDWVYWGKRGVLPVLLSFKYDRTVGSRALRPYDVLQAALSRTRNGAQQLHRLFLLCWQTWRPDAKPEQQAWVDARVRELDARGDHDHRYDALTSILLPETRSLLRSR